MTLNTQKVEGGRARRGPAPGGIPRVFDFEPLSSATTGSGNGVPSSGGGGGGGGGGSAAPFTAAVIPPNGSLIRVTAPTGSDAAELFFAQWEINGVPIIYEIGEQARLDELFGGVGFFDNYQTLNQGGFDAIGGVEMGLIDEQLGEDETIQSQVERGVREAGFGDIPQWIKQSPSLMTLMVQGTAEEWDQGRILVSMSKEDDFKTRFPGFDEFRSGRLGGTGNIQEALDSYVNEEASLRSSLRAIRGPDTGVDNNYLGTLIGSGWTAQEAAQVLEGERQLKQRPDALPRVNALLAFHGKDPLSGTDFLELMRGNAAPDVFEVINDALRREQLVEEGVEISDDLAASLGDGSSLRVTASGQFTDAARRAAMGLLVNRRELDREKLGVSKDDLIAAAFGEGTSGDVAVKLEQFARERQVAGGGFDTFTSFQNQKGRGVVAGLGDI
jgi:hypothetical protein